MENKQKEVLEKIEKIKDMIYEDISEKTPLKFMKKEFGESWESLCKNLAYSNEYFKRIGENKLAVNNFNKRKRFFTLKNGCLDDEQKERTLKIIKIFIDKNRCRVTSKSFKTSWFFVSSYF